MGQSNSPLSFERQALPRPIPGIPYNTDAVRTIFGDVRPMLKHAAKTKELFNWISSQNIKLQSPIIQLFARPFSRPWIIITDFNESQDILLRRTKEFDRSDYLGDLFSGLTPEHHICMKTNDSFKQHRRWLQGLMTPGFLHQIAAPHIYNAVQDLLQLWEKKSMLAKGHPFAAGDDIYRTALDAVWGTVFGVDPSNSIVRAQLQTLSPLERLDVTSDIDKEVDIPDAPYPAVVKSVITLTASLETSLKLPHPAMAWFLRKTPSMRKAYNVKENCIRHEVEKTMKRFSSSTKDAMEVKCAIDDMLYREILLSAKESRAPMLHSRAMYDEIYGFIVAAHDTTATTLTWGLKFLADNPTVQYKLHSEVCSALAQATTEKRDPTVEEITGVSIPYIDAVIEEIIRHSLTSPVVIRRSMVDVDILGHRIPEGTDIFLMANGPSLLSPAFAIDDSVRRPNFHAAKNTVGIWDSPDIADFNPERWLSGEGGEKIYNAAAGPLLTFGLGPRGCYGRKLAYLKLRLFLVLIVWNFELEKCPDELSGYAAVDKLTHAPQKCFVRLKKIC
ncbi:hypothetical protein OIDMADRAFT_45113 [Oidiodendron maius Zn]|uniref:Cytochrome P450 monooxygenase n=1 Tax=Oidiodendron maius (strain Zn) TaxID=913774 RepID=A0A0C3D1N2_OIDMZ|nr:hypothetical protein OIDMADRAFT_45113 [Oidiodendron maius Zn]